MKPIQRWYAGRSVFVPWHTNNSVTALPFSRVQTRIWLALCNNWCLSLSIIFNNDCILAAVYFYHFIFKNLPSCLPPFGTTARGYKWSPPRQQAGFYFALLWQMYVSLKVKDASKGVASRDSVMVISGWICDASTCLACARFVLALLQVIVMPVSGQTDTVQGHNQNNKTVLFQGNCIYSPLHAMWVILFTMVTLATVEDLQKQNHRWWMQGWGISSFLLIQVSFMQTCFVRWIRMASGHFLSPRVTWLLFSPLHFTKSLKTFMSYCGYSINPWSISCPTCSFPSTVFTTALRFLINPLLFLPSVAQPKTIPSSIH